jgi:DNA gyrase subunit B
MTSVFGATPRVDADAIRQTTELELVNRVAALAWAHVFGFDGSTSRPERIPDIVYNVAEPLRLAFLRGFLLGPSSSRRRGRSPTGSVTSSGPSAWSPRPR